MENSYKQVLNRIVTYRKKMNMTQRQMAEKMGITQNHYCKIETGNKAIANKALYNMGASGLDIDYFITGIKSEKTVLNEYFEKCPQNRRKEFIGIVTMYLNLKDTEAESENYRNEISLMNYMLSERTENESIWSCIRQVKNYTQEKMAELMEINIKTYREIERGNSAPNTIILTNVYNNMGYYPTLLQIENPNYLLKLNSMWNRLAEDEAVELNKVINYNLKYLIKKS